MNKRMILATKRTRFQFSRAFSSGPTPVLSLSTCISLLQSCAQNQDIAKGRKIHSRMLVSGYLNSPLSATSLINMYSKCNSISCALTVFHASARLHNVFVYNSILAGLTINDLPIEAFTLFREMRLCGIAPDKFTFPCVIKACSNEVELKNVHDLLFKLGLEFDLFIGSALVHCYLKFELMNDALDIFEALPEKDDIVLWNSMINGYVQIGEFDKALVIFRRMTDIGVVPNRFTITGLLSALALAAEIYNGKLVHAFVIKVGYDSMIAVLNALIDMYGKCGQTADSSVVFESMVEKDIYSWNSIITVHQQCADHAGALRLLKGMLSSGFQPDLVTVTAALPACSHLSASMHGKEIHGYMIKNGWDKEGNTYTDNAIIDMYAKCGRMREAQFVFNGIKIRDVASWNIMVMGYGMHGYGNEAIAMFSRMIEVGLKPDEVSFVGILAACNHAGFISRGQQLLAEMQPRYGVPPAIEHYACIVDMLGRAGKLEEAYELMSNMPIQPNQVVWRSFLAACVLHRNADLAKVASQHVLELEPEHCGNYVLMSNIYGSSGKYEEVAELRQTMRQQDVKKIPGCSWVEINNVMHVFFTGDHSHPEECQIFDRLDSLITYSREYGSMLDVIEGCL